MDAAEQRPFGVVLRAFRLAAGLSQEELAERAQLHRHTISELERGTTAAPYRSTVALLADGLELDAEGRAALEQAARRPRPATGAEGAGGRARQDWGEAPAVPVLQGRTQELTTLAHWVREERCRVVQVLGMGGIGKTALAVRLARDMADEFAAVCWRSLRNAPPPEEWLAGAIGFLSAGQALVPEGFAARLAMLLELLRGQRALLVLDNLETVLEAGAPEARYRAGYEGYGEVLARLSESEHLCCLLLTSREQPLAVEQPAVCALRPGGLAMAEVRPLLAGHSLAGDEAAWQALVRRYGGNPLALKVVGETIDAVFGGDIAAFLAQEVAVVGGVRALLEQQATRLSALQRAVVGWLAVEREPVDFAMLAADLGVARAALMEAVEGLRRRSVLEEGVRGSFTLQPVVLEYATERLVADTGRGVLAGEPGLLVIHTLVKATAKDYVRRSQERLIALPLLEHLRGTGDNAAVERLLLDLLERWRGLPPDRQGYGPGNVVNLLRLLRGDLRGLDLSGLSIRQAYLAGVDAQNASLAGAQLAESVLSESFGAVTSVALTADGTRVAAGTLTGGVLVWRVADRAPLLAVQAGSGAVYVAFSADGRTLATVSWDGTVRLWEAASGRPLATLQGHTAPVIGVALSVDGQTVASGSLDGTVRLWDVATSRPLATLRGHTGGVVGVALSADGRTMASASYDGTVRLWEVASGRLLATLQGHTSGVNGVAFGAGGRTIASGSFDGTVRLWEAASGRPLATLHGHTAKVIGVAFSADGRTVVSAGYDGTVRLWEVASGWLLATLQGHTAPVWGVACSADGRLLASGSLDGTVRLWEAASGRLLATLQGHAGGIYGVAFSANGRAIASGRDDKTVQLWEVESGQLLATLQGHFGVVWGVAFSADGRLLASASLDETVRLWEAESGRPLATLQGHSAPAIGVAFSADGRTVVSGSLDGTVRLWEAASGRLLATLQGHASGVIGVACSADGRTMASGSVDGTVRLWEAASGRPLTVLEGHAGAVYAVAFSADGRLLAGGCHDGMVRLWEVESGRLAATMQGHARRVFSVAFSADGRTLASASLDGTVRLWGAEDGRLLAILQGHTGPVYSVAFSPDGRTIASGSLDGSVMRWDADSFTLLHVLRPDRPYERADITGLTGVTKAQRAALLALGAVDSST